MEKPLCRKCGQPVTMSVSRDVDSKVAWSVFVKCCMWSAHLPFLHTEDPDEVVRRDLGELLVDPPGQTRL